MMRRRGLARGVVQGVGFRPSVARLARELGLGGWVRNAADGAELEIEGELCELDRFVECLPRTLPRAARVDRIEWKDVTAVGETTFCIVPSTGEAALLGIPPDLAPCPDCLAEVRTPGGRRYRYPFTSCASCGPRFTIATAAPYDRERTSMASFDMCDACSSEFGSASDRRYHAQPIACPHCGPSVRIATANGTVLARGDAALRAAGDALLAGEIVALKGVGGYQLLVRADGERAVARLRERKRRPGKPLALLVASVTEARAIADVSELEALALRHPAAPIALLRRKPSAVAREVAPDQPRLGVMLPASPLHALLAEHVAVPLVCTSGNLHEEPLCIDDDEALARLGDIADLFLIHDRAIVQRADDSVVEVVGETMRALRVARGLAPVSVSCDWADEPILAIGGHLKQAPLFASKGRVVIWPHVGDLHTALARDAMADAIERLETLAGEAACAVAIDSHPDYATTIWARQSGRPLRSVQHHHAHVAAVLAEHGRTKALGFAWDGVGLGFDGASWGGETLAVDGARCARRGHLLPFPLPGGDAAARDGRRVLAGVCRLAELPMPLADERAARYWTLAASPRLAPPTTSVGRLFDAFAALTGLASVSRFEGEAAMIFEGAAEPGAAPYSFSVDEGVLDWRPMLAEAIGERADARRVASRFHATLVAMIVEVVRREAAKVVALAGGCFANRLLLEGTSAALADIGVEVLHSVQVPPGDGGLALGQAWVISREGASCA